MNILIKLTCLVGLVIAPILGDGHGNEKANASCHGKQKCEMNSNHGNPSSCNPSTCTEKENCDMAKCNGENVMKCDM